MKRKLILGRCVRCETPIFQEDLDEIGEEAFKKFASEGICTKCQKEDEMKGEENEIQ